MTKTPGQHREPRVPPTVYVDKASKATVSSASAALGDSVSVMPLKTCAITKIPATATGAATGRVRVGIASKAGQAIFAENVHPTCMVKTARHFARRQKLAVVMVAARTARARVIASRGGLVSLVTSMRRGILGAFPCRSNANGTHRAAAPEDVPETAGVNAMRTSQEKPAALARKGDGATSATFCVRLKPIAQTMARVQLLGRAIALLPFLGPRVQCVRVEAGQMNARNRATGKPHARRVDAASIRARLLRLVCCASASKGHQDQIAGAAHPTVLARHASTRVSGIPHAVPRDTVEAMGPVLATRSTGEYFASRVPMARMAKAATNSAIGIQHAVGAVVAMEMPSASASKCEPAKVVSNVLQADLG